MIIRVNCLHKDLEDNMMSEILEYQQIADKSQITHSLEYMIIKRINQLNNFQEMMKIWKICIKMKIKFNFKS